VLIYAIRVTAIAQGDEKMLTRLNSSMRMIDLVSRILCPVSSLHPFESENLAWPDGLCR